MYILEAFALLHYADLIHSFCSLETNLIRGRPCRITRSRHPARFLASDFHVDVHLLRNAWKTNTTSTTQESTTLQGVSTITSSRMRLPLFTWGTWVTLLIASNTCEQKDSSTVSQVNEVSPNRKSKAKFNS